MKKFYMAGQSNFGNRGCEALVRSTIQLINQQFPGSKFLTPSFDPVADGKQWPEAKAEGVEFVKVNPFPAKLRWYGRLLQLFSSIKKFWLPAYTVPEDVRSAIRSCDALIMIGGDNFTLDYGVPSLLWNTGLAEQALKDGIPAMLWAASAGPFLADPDVERHMSGFLNRLTAVTVRETTTLDYLASIGVAKDVSLVTDPAFVMIPQPFDISNILPEVSEGGLLGFNISPLIQKFRTGHEDVLLDEVAGFIENAVTKKNLSVVLVPHVDPLSGSSENSDSHYMGKLMARLGTLGSKVTLAPSVLNAVQLKFLISQCRYFIGARTHSTIAALSTSVPTLSIAYSIKAKGLNKNLFGHNDYVLETPLVSKDTLLMGLDNLLKNETEIKRHLSEVIPQWREKAHESVNVLAKIIS